MTINLPFPVFGKIYDTDGTTLMGSGVIVKLRNESTGELLTGYTNASSEYGLDGGNFASGYNLTDKFTIYTYSENLYKETTLNVSDNKHHFDLTLATITDSTLINYTTVQKVWNKLDEIGASDTSAIRIIESIQEAESEIEEKAQIVFKSSTATQEIYDYNQYTTYFSSEQLSFYDGRGRSDYMNVNFTDRLQIRNRPIISITTLQRNTAGETQADSWGTLTERTGSAAGDYIISDEGKKAGFVDFIGNKPRYGKRAVRITYTYGYATTPRNVQKLTTLIAVKDIVLAKISRSFYDTPHPISLRGIAIGRTADHSTYIRLLDMQIDKLWEGIGSEFRTV